MSDLLTLPAVLERRAAADPESPFLFWPEGWDWRWWSWRQAADLVARWSAALAGLPPGSAVRFAGERYPEAIALDLAVQRAGMTPVPQLAPAQAMERGAGAAATDPPAAGSVGSGSWLLEVAGGEARVTRIEEMPLATDASGPGTPVPGGERGSGALVVADAAGWHRLALADLVAAAAAVEAAVRGGLHGDPGRGAPDPPHREVLVGGWPLGEWPARLLTAWVLTAGAALVLDGDPARWWGSVRWARPTVFYGTEGEVARLRLQVEAHLPGRWRAALGRARLAATRLARVGWARTGAAAGNRARPRAARAALAGGGLGRLRTIFQSGEPAPDEVAFWQERGVRLLPLPPERRWRKRSGGSAVASA